jgi:hypothetical protein
MVSVFYHARLTLKPDRAKDSGKIAFEADLTLQDLMEKIAQPFVRGTQFFCGGVIVQPSKVEEVRFAETQQSSQDLLPLINARRITSGILTVHPAEWEVIWQGQDITRRILT